MKKRELIGDDEVANVERGKSWDVHNDELDVGNSEDDDCIQITDWVSKKRNKVSLKMKK